MRKIIFHGHGCIGGLGDALVGLKVLFALKSLYPQDEILYYYPHTAFEFFSKIGFIDGIINSNQTSFEQASAYETRHTHKHTQKRLIFSPS